MNTLKHLVIFIAVLFIIPGIQAQDVHFSQFAMSPLLLNPSLAGLSNGDYRVYANFRTQWNTVNNGDAYRTLAAGVDMAIGKAAPSGSYAGIGLSFFSDQSGAVSFNTNNISLTAAYHIMLNRNHNTSLSIGLQGGGYSRGFDASKALYDFNYDQGTGAITTGQRESFSRTQVYYADVSAGLFFTTTLRSGTDLYIGSSLGHINQPTISYFSGAASPSAFNERLDMKFTAHGGASIVVNPKLWFVPNFFMMIQGPASQYNAGAMFKMQIGNKVLTKNFLYLGAQVRIANAMDIPMADAVIAHVRFDYKGLTVGLSYDVNISKLNVSTSSFGAPEVSLMYTIKSKYKNKYQGYCPVMM